MSGLILAVSAALFAAAEPKLLFHAPLSETTEAQTPAGALRPCSEKRLEFRKDALSGGALYVTGSRGAKFAYPADGIVNPQRGTLAFSLRCPETWDDRRHRIFRIATDAVQTDRDKLSGTGVMSISFQSGSLSIERDDVNGSVFRPQALPPDNGRWQRYVLVWDEFGAWCYVTDGVRVVKPRTRAKPGAQVNCRFNPPKPNENRKIWIGMSPDGGSTLHGLIRDVRVWDGPLPEEQILKSFGKYRQAEFSVSAHFGTEDVAKAVTVRAEPFGGRSLRLTVVDAAGKVVVDGGALPNRKSEKTLQLKLPFGEYRIRLVDDAGDVVAEERYGVLSRINRAELPPIVEPGTPKNLRKVWEWKLEGDALSPKVFRAVGGTSVKELNGVKYLEAGRGQWNRFVIRFPVDVKRPLHLLEFDYPDNEKRTMELIVQDAKCGQSDYVLQTGVMCGGEYPLANRIETRRCLWWTGSSPDAALVVSTIRGGAPAAISAVRLYEVTDAALPSAKTFLPPATDDGWHRYVGHFWEDPAVVYDFRANMSSLEGLNRLIDRYAAQLKYCGHNLVAYPGAWYEGLIARGEWNVRGHREHYLEAFYEKFDREGIAFMPTMEVLNVTVEGCVFRPGTGPLTNADYHATAFSVHDQGYPVIGWHNSPVNFNVSHPGVQAELTRMFTALADEGAPHPSFKGITLFLPVDVCFWWGMLETGYNDYTIDGFVESVRGQAQDETLKSVLAQLAAVDRSDARRGKRYAEILKTQAYEAWVQYRCDVVTDFYARLAKILRDRRADLKLKLDIETPADPNRDLKKYPDYYEDGMHARLLREGGIDVAALSKRIPNLIYGPIVAPSRHRKRDNWLKTPELFERYIAMQSNGAWYREFAAAAFPQVVMRDDFWESDIGRQKGKLELSGDWFTEHGWRVSTLHASGRNALRYFAVPLRWNDVLGLTRGGFLIGDYGLEALEAEFIRNFTALPAVKFETLSDPGAAVAFRHVRFKGVDYWYVCNTSDTPRAFACDFPKGAEKIVTGEKASGRCRLTLKPYELLSFRCLAE